MSRYSRCSRVEVGVQGQLGHAEDAVHGRADLVAHVGQELALGPVGRLGRLLRRLQLHFRLLALGDLTLQLLVGHVQVRGAFRDAEFKGVVGPVESGRVVRSCSMT